MCVFSCSVPYYQVPYYPPLQSPADFTPAVCRQLIADAAGWPLAQLQQQPAAAGSAAGGQGGLQLHSVKSWVMSAVVAEDYCAWGGRVMLAGDAAHRWGLRRVHAVSLAVATARFAWGVLGVCRECGCTFGWLHLQLLLHKCFTCSC
jgi:hypothetical protein